MPIHQSLLKSKIVVDRRDNITSGKRSDTGPPMSLDHFNIQKFPELVAEYGPKPKELILFFTRDVPEENFTTDRFAKWGRAKGTEGRGIVTRSCDGIECLHRTNYSLLGRNFVAGEMEPCICKGFLDRDNPAHKELICKADVYFAAHIYCMGIQDIAIPLCYHFETHSFHSYNNIIGHLRDIAKSKGQLRGIPFVLSVEMKTAPGKRYPLWELRVAGTTVQLNRMIETVNAKGLLGGVPMDKKMLEAPVQGSEEIPDPDAIAEAEVVHESHDSLDTVPAATKMDLTLSTEVFDGLMKSLDALPLVFTQIMDWKKARLETIDKLPKEQLQQIWAKINEKIKLARESNAHG